MARLLHQWKFDARHLTLVAIAVTAIATGIFIWLFVSPPAELQAQVLVGPTVSRVTPSGSKIFLETGDTQEFTNKRHGWEQEHLQLGMVIRWRASRRTVADAHRVHHQDIQPHFFNSGQLYGDGDIHRHGGKLQFRHMGGSGPRSHTRHLPMAVSQTLGGLTAGVSRNGAWERRLRVHAPERQLRPVLLVQSQRAGGGADRPDLFRGHLPLPAARGGLRRDGARGITMTW